MAVLKKIVKVLLGKCKDVIVMRHQNGSPVCNTDLMVTEDYHMYKSSYLHPAMLNFLMNNEKNGECWCQKGQ